MRNFLLRGRWKDPPERPGPPLLLTWRAAPCLQNGPRFGRWPGSSAWPAGLPASRLPIGRRGLCRHPFLWLLSPCPLRALGCSCAPNPPGRKRDGEKVWLFRPRFLRPHPVSLGSDCKKTHKKLQERLEREAFLQKGKRRAEFVASPPLLVFFFPGNGRSAREEFLQRCFWGTGGPGRRDLDPKRTPRPLFPSCLYFFGKARGDS